MKQTSILKLFSVLVLGLLQLTTSAQQDFEWRLTNAVFSGTDPDGGGPATGSVQFTLQLRTRNVGATIPINAMTTGFAWQNSNAMVPTGVTCGTNSVPQPSNITMSPAFAGYTYNNVNHCSGSVSFTTGGQTFDRRAVGTIDGGLDVVISNAWTDVMTVTLWSRGASAPQAGYVVLNSTNAGTPGPFSNYDISDAAATPYDANSLTYTTPLALGSTALPVTFSSYNVQCNSNGVSVSWRTAGESNSSHFVIQKSTDGSNWSDIGSVLAAGNSSSEKAYQFFDIAGGAAQYRVKQVDKDGRAVYTEIKRTTCEGKPINVLLFPVPAKDRVNVAIRSDKNIKTELVVSDAAGRIVMKQSVTIGSGSNNFGFDVSRLAAGEYILTSSDPSLPISKRFVVAR